MPIISLKLDTGRIGRNSPGRRSNPSYSTYRFSVKNCLSIHARTIRLSSANSIPSLRTMLHVGQEGRVPEMGTINSPVPEVEQAEKPAGLMTGVALLSLIIAVLSLLLFFWIGTEVREGDTMHFDLSVRSWFHQ